MPHIQYGTLTKWPIQSHCAVKPSNKSCPPQNQLHDIEKAGLSPNLETFHCVLRLMRIMSTQEAHDTRHYQELVKKVPMVLAEMRELDIRELYMLSSLDLLLCFKV